MKKHKKNNHINEIEQMIREERNYNETTFYKSKDKVRSLKRKRERERKFNAA